MFLHHTCVLILCKSIFRFWLTMSIFKVHIFKVKIMIFPVVMCGCESCTLRWWVLKSWSFRTVLLEKTLGVPWTARKSNQLLLKEINPEYSLKGLMLKLKLQYFGHLIRKADSLEKILMLGKIEGRKRRGQWLDGVTASRTWVWAIPGDSEGQGSPTCRTAWCWKELDTA